MNQDEAKTLCERHAAEHPERKTAQWRPQQVAEGEWTVVKIGLPPAQETTPEVEAAERPPTADDPRAPIFQNIPPYGAGF